MAELYCRQPSCTIFKTYASSSISSAAGVYDAYPEDPLLENIASTGGLRAAGVVHSFIDALNSRDLSGMLLLLADDCHHEDLSHEGEANTKEEVARFYSNLVASLPERVRVVVDDITGGDDTRAGLMWHMEVDGIEVPCSRGLSFYRVRPWSAQEAHTRRATLGRSSGGDVGGGLITYIRQSPEHFLKLSGMVLSASASATPLIDSLGPMALPGFWSNLARGASNMIASAPPMDEVLRSLAAAGAANTAPTVPGLLMGSGAGFGGSGSAAVQHRPGGGFSTAPVVGPHGRGGGGSGAGVFDSTRSSFVQASPYRYQPRSPPIPSVPSAAPDAAAIAATADSDTVSAMAHAHAMPMVFAATFLVNAAPPVVTPASVVDPVAMAPAPNTARVPEAPQPSPERPLRGHDNQGLAARAAMGASYRTEASPAALLVGLADGVASSAGEDTAAAPAVALTSLAGIWEKDLEASDVAGYEKALDMWQISGVQKATAKLIEGLELAVRPGTGRGASGGGMFNVHFLTIIPYFKVTESYPLGGGHTKMRRRDQRSGESQAHAEAVSNGVVCRAAWGAPLPGELEESYTLPDPVARPDLLYVRSTLRLGGKEATTLQVYHRRRNMSARELISASEKRNGQAHDVLRRFGMT